MWRERRKLVEMWRAGRAAALATLVAVEGSSYRRPGARLMIGTDGDYAGSISGGCLEAEVVRKARWLVRHGAAVQRYSTAFDDTAEIPYGLGCGGSVEVLLEPADTPEFEALMEALAGSLRGEASHVETVLPVEGRALSRVVRAGRSEAEYASSVVPRYHEHLQTPPRLLVFGAGDDAQALVSMVALLGWSVVVVDGRAQLARPERFPGAEATVVADPHASSAPTLRADDFAVVMTHSFEQDLAWLQLLVPARLPYVGLLGAKHRSALLASKLSDLLHWPLEDVCDYLRAPVGLDLGGDGAEAIALAITAEMQACASHKPPTARRMTATTAAEQMVDADISRYLRAQCPV